MKSTLEKVLTVGFIITPFVIIGNLISNDDNCRNNFNAFCKRLEVLYPNEVIETESQRITCFNSRLISKWYLLSSYVTLPITALLKVEGIITDSNFFSFLIIALNSTFILAYKDSFLVENLNNQQITQESFNIAGDKIADELKVDEITFENLQSNVDL
jgi:hypothetical protein